MFLSGNKFLWFFILKIKNGGYKIFRKKFIIIVKMYVFYEIGYLGLNYKIIICIKIIEIIVCLEMRLIIVFFLRVFRIKLDILLILFNIKTLRELVFLGRVFVFIYYGV